MRKINQLIHLICLFIAIGCTSPSEKIEIKTTPVMEDWYTTTSISTNTFSIEEPKSSQGNVSYLIAGDSKALMIDTGSGENLGFGGSKIKYIIDKLTDVPVSLVLSHFHFDHNQNIHEFNNIAFPDLPFLRQRMDQNTYTFSSEELFSGSYPAQVTVTEWLPLNTDIDLGNRIVELINIQGHTNESIALIDKTNKQAFLGDFLYNGTLFLFTPNDINSYKASVDLLIAKLDSNYRLFGAHGTPEISYSNLKELQDFLDCIQSNTCTPINQLVWGKDTQLYQYNSMRIRIFL